MYYILAKDLVHVLVGPFDTHKQAQDHIDFCATCGASGSMEVVTQEAARVLSAEGSIHGGVIAAERDRLLHLRLFA